MSDKTTKCCKRSKNIDIRACRSLGNVELYVFALNLNKFCVKGKEGHVRSYLKTLREGPRFNINAYLKKSTLSTVVSLGYFRIAQLLIEQGADVNQPDSFRGTLALRHFIPKYEHGICLALLLQHGAEIQEPGLISFWIQYILESVLGNENECQLVQERPYGITPLSHAIDVGNVDMVSYLLAKGACPNTDNIFTKSFCLEPEEDTEEARRNQLSRSN